MGNDFQILNYRKEQIKMPIHIIPVDKLSAEALDGVIKEFIFRDGTDYGEFEASVEKKFKQIKDKLENGLAVLIYDDEMETTNIFRHDDPILKKIDQMNEE
ncbi:MAG: YheU family protein [Syntrophales bacterium LBB04]|nr:YheU family protein [Syntrophales bacterium LBB04]